QFEIDAVKIDRSFVLAQGSERGAQVMSGLLRFCEALDLQIIVQGWFYSKALSGDDMMEFARRRPPAAASRGSAAVT
ncbi:PTS sugar transporter subunit IIC, partial [Achromobacter xylosoxidans]|nr:PTS sugar transporter subunit IIC [Achromobacter xylosoxidans]